MSDPWLEKTRWNSWEINPGEHELKVNVGCNQNVIIDKLYGPLCSSNVRVRLEFEGDKTEWVIEEENFNTNKWIERARFNCQEFYKKEYQPTDKRE